MKICFLTKIEKPGVKEAIAFTKVLTKTIEVYYGDITYPFPDNIANKNYDLIISYISPWIVPKIVLENTKKWNNNFHPGTTGMPEQLLAADPEAVRFGCQ